MKNIEKIIKERNEAEKIMKAKELTTVCKNIEPVLDKIIAILDDIKTEEASNLAIEFCTVKYHLVNIIFDMLKETLFQPYYDEI